MCLVVGFLFNPSPRISSEDELPQLIIAEDEERERNCRKPPACLEWIHPQAFVHPRSVAEEGGEECLENETKVKHNILHALLEDGILTSFTDD